MKCRVCKKEFLEDELTEGYCDECFEKSSDEKEKNMPNSKHIYGYYNDIANKFKLLKWVVLTLGIILTMYYSSNNKCCKNVPSV